MRSRDASSKSQLELAGNVVVSVCMAETWCEAIAIMFVGHSVPSMAEATQSLFEPFIMTWSTSVKPKMPIPAKLIISSNVARYFIRLRN